MNNLLVALLTIGSHLVDASYLIPAEKYIQICKSLGGKIPSKIETIHTTAPYQSKTIPISSNDLICVKKSSMFTKNSTISSIIKVPGGPCPWKLSSTHTFHDDCKSFCAESKYSDPHSNIVTLNDESNVGVCTCYDLGIFPVSPGKGWEKSGDREHIFEIDDDGRIPKAEEPIDPFTFQTKEQYLKQRPKLGPGAVFGGSEACLSKINNWPYPDMVACKEGGKNHMLEVSGAMTVWESSQNGAVSDLCQLGEENCESACSSSSKKYANQSSLSACFHFISTPDMVSFICMCADGTYPTKLEGFQLMSSMDEKTGKMNGEVQQLSFGLKLKLDYFLIIGVLIAGVFN